MPYEVETCYRCGDTLASHHNEICCTCETFVKLADCFCPECGATLFEYNDPAEDHTLGVYCSNKHCNYTHNQFLSWAEIKGDL